MLTDLVQLRTFVTVAEERHLTRAAERLHISQSAASMHVRAIEESLGSKVFSRTNRNLELTHAGELLLERARVLLKEEAIFASFAREIRGKMEGNLVVSATSEPGTRIGEIVGAIRAKHPLVTLTLSIRPSAGAREALKSGELDVGIFLGRKGDPSFTFHEVDDLDFCVAGPASWKETVETAGWEDLARLPWITPTASSAYATILGQLFGEKGLQLNTVIRFEHGMLGRAALEAGSGVMLLPKDIAQCGERAGQLCISPIVNAQFTMSIVHLASRARDPLIKAFVEAGRVVWPQMRSDEPS